MENKNILLIIASVCLFFVIIIGASAFLFYPGDNADSDYSTTQEALFNSNSNTVEYNSGNNAGAENNGNGNNTELTGDENREQENEMELDTETVSEQMEEDTEIQNTGVQNLVNGYIEEENEIQLVERTTKTLTTQKPSYEPSTTQTNQTTTQTTTQTTQNTQTTITQTNTQTKPSKEYWIQAASYKNLSLAENMNTTLRDIGIVCTIQTKDIYGDTWYRLRIGPYANYNEAEKFLMLIKTIDGLEDSLIWEVSR